MRIYPPYICYKHVLTNQRIDIHKHINTGIINQKIEDLVCLFYCRGMMELQIYNKNEITVVTF